MRESSVTTLPRQKRCGRCQRRRWVTSFYANRGRPDGRQAWCRDCEKARQRERRAKAKAAAIT